MMKKTTVLALIAGVALASTASASGFTGDYAPANWTFQTNQNGFVAQHDASTLVLVGPDNGSFAFGFSDIFVVVPQSGSISFDWSYTSNDDPGFDAGFYIANSFFFLSDTDGQSGSVSGVTVNVGDLFGFSVETIDSLFGPGVLTITNFSYVPAPGSLAILGLAGLAARRRR